MPSTQTLDMIGVAESWPFRTARMKPEARITWVAAQHVIAGAIARSHRLA